MADEPKKKPNIVLRLLAFLVTLALMLGAVALVVYRDKLSLDALQRYFTYRNLEKSDTGQVESFPLDWGGKGGFSDVGGDLLAWAPSGVHLYSPGGVEYLNESMLLARPVADTGGNAAVVYDAGGSLLRVYAQREQTFAIDAEPGGEILSARLNPAGRLTVTSRAQGYKGVVTVYDAKYEPLLGLRLSSRFVTDGLLSQDGKTVGVLTVGQLNGVFDTALALYTLDGEEPFATLSLGTGLVLDMETQGGQFWIVGESALTILGPDGAVMGQYDYGGRYLKSYSLGGDGFATLLLGKYRAGSGATLVTVDETGAQMATQEFTDQVLDLTAAGRYAAVLTAGGLTVCTGDLEPYGTSEAAAGARRVVLRSDGTAFLVGASSARLYLPG